MKMLQEAFKAEAKASAPKIMKNCTSLEVHEVRQANCLTYVEGGAVDGCARCGLARNRHPTAKAAAKANTPKKKYSMCQEYVLRQAAKAALKPSAPLAERKTIVVTYEKCNIWISKSDKGAMAKAEMKKKQKTWEEATEEALKAGAWIAKEEAWEAAWSGKAAKAEEGKEVTKAEEAWLEAVEAEEARRRRGKEVA